MIPRVRKQLEEAHVALEDLVSALAGEEEIAASTEYKDAAALVAQVDEAWQAEAK